MPTIQIWVTNEEMEDLRRLKAFLEDEQEERFDGKDYLMSSGRRRRRIRRDKINYSYIYREALKLFWFENEKHVRDFEERSR